MIYFTDLCLQVCALTTLLAIIIILPLLRTVSSQCSVSEFPTDFENTDKERMTRGIVRYLWDYENNVS